MVLPALSIRKKAIYSLWSTLCSIRVDGVYQAESCILLLGWDDMSAVSYILTITDNDALPKEVSSCVKKMAKDLFSKSLTFSEASRQPLDQPPLFILVDLACPSAELSSVLSSTRARYSECPIIGLGQPTEVSVVLELIKLGIKDFVSYPLQDGEIKRLIEQAQAVYEATPKRTSQGRIITCYSPKGGIGVSFLVANLAVAMAEHFQSRTAVVDLSSNCGDVATYLNLTPKYTIRDLLDNNQLLDQSFLDGIMASHASGVRVIAGPHETQNPTNADHIQILKSVFSLLKESEDFIFVDAGHIEPGLLQFIFSESDEIFLLGSPDVSSIKGLITLFKKMRGLHFDPSKIKIVINRHNSKYTIDVKQFEKLAQHNISFYLPNNYTLCIQSVNSGEPILDINDKADLSKKILEIAQSIKCDASPMDGVDAKELAGAHAKPVRKGLF